MVEAGEMLEHAEVFGRRYGTPRAPVEAALAAGRDVLFDIDWQGHLQLRARLPGDVEGVFLLPPCHGGAGAPPAWRAARTPRRRSPAAWTRRATRSRHWTDFGHVLVNRDFADTVASVRAILHAARARPGRQPCLAPFVAELLRGG